MGLEPRRGSGRWLAVAVVVLSLWGALQGHSPAFASSTQRPSWGPVEGGERSTGPDIVVRFRSRATESERRQARREADTRFLRGLEGLPRTQLVRAESSRTRRRALHELRQDAAVVWAEPKIRYRAIYLPPAGRFAEQWGLRNTGQTVEGTAGTAGADVRATEAWDVTTGIDDVTVAVIDSGVALDHAAFAANGWTNQGEASPDLRSNGVDDDGNGFVDDWRGWDFVANGNAPRDYHGHGTHVAGIAAANGSAEGGVAGVALRSRVMDLRALNANGEGWSTDVAQAASYAAREGAQVVNLSLGGAYSHALDDAIAGNPETLFVVAAGNDSADGDDEGTASYPCALRHRNVVCVAATDQRDRLAAFSNFGAQTVALGAPGVNVLSAQPYLRTVLSDDFERGVDGWEIWRHRPESTTWRPDQRLAHSPTHSLVADPEGAAGEQWTIARSPVFEHWGLDGCELEFRLWASLVTKYAGVGVELREPDGGHVGELGAYIAPMSKADAPVRLRFDHLRRRGGYPMRVQFSFSDLNPEPSGDRAAVDDVRVRCADPAVAPGASFAFHSGTSMAAPFVSGAAALLWSRAPQATPAQVREALLTTADPQPSLAGKTISGGRLNVAKALAALAPTDPRPPVTPAPVFTSPPAQGDGLLEPTFGLRRLSEPAIEGFGIADMRVQPDDKIVTAGTVGRNGWMGSRVGLMRFLPSGELDPSFGDGGAVITNASRGVSPGASDHSSAYAMALQPDGKIVAVGDALVGEQQRTEVPVLRYLPDGRLDPSFADGGEFLTPLGEGFAQGSAVRVQPDGKIVVAAMAIYGPKFAVFRLLPDGRLDRSFASGGIYYGDAVPYDYAARPSDLEIQPDGRIVVAGDGYHRGESVLALERLRPDGTPDPTFGANGVKWGPGGGSKVQIALQPDGKIVAVASEGGHGYGRPMVVRYLPDGKLDRSFGLGGAVFRGTGEWEDRGRGRDVVLQRNGALIVLADRGGAQGDRLSLFRLLPDGRPDTSWGNGGETNVAGAGGGAMTAGRHDDVFVSGADGDGRFLARYVAGAPTLGTEPEPPPADTTPPETSLSGGPSGTSRAADASFEFTASEAGSSFECRLDGRPWSACTSPTRYSDLGAGLHSFAVRARDPAGNMDPSPASRDWTICRPSSSTYASLVAGEPALAAYWRLGEPSGNVACDSVGTHDGAYTAGVTLARAGLLSDDADTAADFDGSTGAAAIPSAAALNPTRALTLEAWARPRSVADSATLMRKQGQYLLRVADGTVVVRIWTAGGTTLELATGPIMEAGATQHLAATFDGSALRLYRNGVEVASRSALTTMATSVDPLRLGESGGYDHFAGTLDEVAVYGAALSGERVRAHYGEGARADVDPPDTRLLETPTGAIASRSARLTFEASESGASFECSLDGGAFAACSSPAVYESLPDGDHVFRARAVDAAGNRDPTPATASWRVDATAPETRISTAPPARSRTSSATFEFDSDEKDATYECRLDGRDWTACESPRTYADLGIGPHEFEVRATDGLGNRDPSPAAHRWTIEPSLPPTGGAPPNGGAPFGAVVALRDQARAGAGSVRIPLAVVCSAPCTANSTLSLGGRGLPDADAVGAGRMGLEHGGARWLAIRLRRSAARRLRSADTARLLANTELVGSTGQATRLSVPLLLGPGPTASGRRLGLAVRCSSLCTVSARVQLGKAALRRIGVPRRSSMVIAEGRLTLVPDAAKAVFMRIGRGARARLMRSGRVVPATVRIDLAEPGGNVWSLAHGFVLRP